MEGIITDERGLWELSPWIPVAEEGKMSWPNKVAKMGNPNVCELGSDGNVKKRKESPEELKKCEMSGSQGHFLRSFDRMQGGLFP